MQRIQLNRSSGVPVFRQVIDQIVFMIEAGELRDGDRLPSGRLLAANLGVNRNTTARAYAELGRLGYLASQGRRGMVVKRSARARKHLASHESAVAVLAEPIRRCLELGLSADDIAAIAYHESLQAQKGAIRIGFVECNEQRAKTFAAELSETVGSDVQALLLADLVPAQVSDCDLVVTTFFHNAEVRRQLHAMSLAPQPEVLAIVAAPHIKTLTKLAAIPKNKRIGILYSTDDQSEAIRQSLADTGLENVTVLHGPHDTQIDTCDLVVVPSDDPVIAEQARRRATVIEFGNVLDAASRRMVAEIVDEIRERKEDMVDRRPSRTSADN